MMNCTVLIVAGLAPRTAVKCAIVSNLKWHPGFNGEERTAWTLTVAHRRWVVCLTNCNSERSRLMSCCADVARRGSSTNPYPILGALTAICTDTWQSNFDVEAAAALVTL
ncbi:hypothetical protein PR003_g1736 [Phytophthora rubi]|uniref:Uncharacterized protein n=1 Tax=Phytophthora rubi TaxID=129364 RepID=A0A6A3NCE3_9STRA|nr:hypothetical protein PR002_g5586 [Phytophthora rubi]KAE9045498.1 hypothetical protein PR001_g4943 [Phytophthora rubi]KAE9357524.1 hypothetical protein PR003_g1736 [Phytophthora rubi]